MIIISLLVLLDIVEEFNNHDKSSENKYNKNLNDEKKTEYKTYSNKNTNKDCNNGMHTKNKGGKKKFLDS